MKKLSVIMVCFLCAISMLACIPERQKPGLENVYKKFEGEIERNVVLKVLENDTAKKAGYLDELFAGFNEKYKEYNVTAVDAKMGGFTDLAQLGPLGYGPDILYQANDQIMKYAEDRHVQPLPVEKLDDYDKFPDNAWKAFQTTKSDVTFTCGIPINIQSPMLYYREDKLPANWKADWDNDKNDVPDMLENWNDMHKYSTQIMRSNPPGSTSESKNYGYMQSFSDQYFSSGFLFSYGAYIFGGGNDISDIGLSKNDSELGGSVIRQLATNMNMGTTDDSIIVKGYAKLAEGNYFACISTPDTYSLFFDELLNHYMVEEGLSKKMATEKATTNLKRVALPSKLPASGVLTDYDSGWIDMKTMGGINGYSLSSYCKAPKAALEFIKYATSFEMTKRRTEVLNLAAARSDLSELSSVSKDLYDNLEAGRIVLMPSTAALSAVWPPLATFFKEVSGDVFLEPSKQLYTTNEKIKQALKKVDDDIYKVLHLL